MVAELFDAFIFFPLPVYPGAFLLLCSFLLNTLQSITFLEQLKHTDGFKKEYTHICREKINSPSPSTPGPYEPLLLLIYLSRNSL